MTDMICKAIHASDGGVRFESAKTAGLTLSQTIEDDKKYGFLEPANGKYYTYKILNEDDEFTEEDIHKAVKFSFGRWMIYTKVKELRLAQPGEHVDLSIEFRTVDTDPRKNLTPSTIMYHFYPISDLNNPNRGVCVVNKSFFFTSHGNTVSGEELMKHGIRVQFPNGRYETIDFDVVYCHELGHGVLGLPHDTEDFSIMSTPYSKISEMPSMRDQVRSRAKAGTRVLTAWGLRLWIGWTRWLADGY